MKNWFHRLILILFFVGVTPAFAGLADGPPVDRKAIFEKAYQILAVVMDQSRDMSMYNNDLNGQEMETFRKIAQVVYSDFHSRKKDRLVFSDDQELFKLDPSQPIRTAVTSSDPADPIYINLKVINAANSQFQLEDAIQILVHEYGHKTTDKVQATVDSVATKLRTFNMGSITRSTTDRGEILTTMGFQTLFGGAEVNKLISGRSEQEKIMLLETMLYQNAKGVFDVSPAWSNFLASHPGYVSKQKNILVNTGINILKMTFDRSQGEKIIFHIDYQQDSVATPTGRMGAGDNHIDFMRQGSIDLSTEVTLNREKGTIQSVFLRRYLIPQPQLAAKIDSIVQIDKETFQLVAAIRTPFDFKNIKLVIESAFEQYSITAKEFTRGKDRVVFEFKVPQVAVETPVMIRSLIAEDRALIFFDEGIGIKVKPMPLPPGELAFKSAYFTDGTTVSDYVNPKPIESSKAALVVMVKSPVDLVEVRLGFRTDLAVLNPDAQFSSLNKPAVIGMDKIDSIRSSYEVRHFDSSQFKQVRKGDYVEVSVPVTMYVKDVRSPYPSKDGEVFAAINQGTNAIVNIEIIDRNLRSLRLGGPGKFMPYILKTPWSAPTLWRAGGFVAPSCSGLFGAH